MMKIAIFLLIVGLSGCLGGEVSVPKCHLKMAKDHAGCMTDAIIDMLRDYDQKRDSDDECKISCHWDKIYYTMDLMSGATGCPFDVITFIVASQLPRKWKPFQIRIRTLLMQRNTEELKKIDFTSEDMIDTCIRAMAVVLKSQGFDPVDCFENSLFNLAGVLGKVEVIVGNLAEVLRAEIRIITEVLGDGSSRVTLNGRSTQVGACLEAADSSSILPLLGNLLGHVTTILSCPAQLSDVLGEVGGVVGGIVGNVLGLLLGNAGNLLSTAGDTVGNLVDLAGNVLILSTDENGNIWNTATNTVVGTVLDSAGRNVGICIDGNAKVWDARGNLLGLGSNLVPSFLDGLLEGVAGSAAGILWGVGNALTDVTDGVGNALTDVTDGVGNALADVTDGVGNALTDVTDGVGDVFGRIFS